MKRTKKKPIKKTISIEAGSKKITEAIAEIAQNALTEIMKQGLLSPKP